MQFPLPWRIKDAPFSRIKVFFYVIFCSNMFSIHSSSLSLKVWVILFISDELKAGAAPFRTAWTFASLFVLGTMVGPLVKELNIQYNACALSVSGSSKISLAAFGFPTTNNPPYLIGRNSLKISQPFWWSTISRRKLHDFGTSNNSNSLEDSAWSIGDYSAW